MCCNVYSLVMLNLNPFKIIKKCKSEFCLKIHETLFIKKRNPSLNNRRRRRRLEGHPLQVRHKQDWGREFIHSLPKAAVLPGLDAGSDIVKPASGFVIQNRQTSCSMWCPMYEARY